MHLVIKMTDYNVLMNQDNMIIIWDTAGMSIQYVRQFVNRDLAGDSYRDLSVMLRMLVSMLIDLIFTRPSRVRTGQAYDDQLIDIQILLVIPRYYYQTKYKQQ